MRRIGTSVPSTRHAYSMPIPHNALIALSALHRDGGYYYPDGTLDDLLLGNPALASAFRYGLIDVKLGGAWGTLDALVLTHKGYEALGTEPPVTLWRALRQFFGLEPRAHRTG